MNTKGLSELRRRLNPSYRNPTALYGRYVTASGKTLSEFREEIISLTETDNAKYMELFKKVLSGTFGQNLLDVEFPAASIMDGAEYRLLNRLRDSALKDENTVSEMMDRIASTIPALRGPVDEQSVRENQEADNYLILLMYDAYGVPYRNSNGEADTDRSDELFNYLLCCVCPVKQNKATLNYAPFDGHFHTGEIARAVAAPEEGFLYPAFEERAADLYHALYYTRNSSDTRDEFIRRVFGTDPQMPAGQQTEVFRGLLEETLGEECSLDIVQAVHETVRERIEEQKEDKTAEAPKLNRQDVREVLTECGVSEEKAAAFEERYGQCFGETAELPAVNLVTPKKFNVTTPNVSIQVNPEFSNLVETRIIDGKRYILVLADGEVEVNGVRVRS